MEHEPISIISRFGSRRREQGMCVLQAVAYSAGERHTDTPDTCCPVLATYGRRLNDEIPRDAQRTRFLKPLIQRLVGSKAGWRAEAARAQHILDATRTRAIPMGFQALGLLSMADRLRNAPDSPTRGELQMLMYPNGELPHDISYREFVLARSLKGLLDYRPPFRRDSQMVCAMSDSAVALTYVHDCLPVAQADHAWGVGSEILMEASRIGG